MAASEVASVDEENDGVMDIGEEKDTNEANKELFSLESIL